MKQQLHWDCRETAKSYVNTASVLAGFAFSAVILVVQITPPTISNAALLRDWSSIAFLVGFFGCMVSSFTFSVIAGEEEIVPRTFTLMLLGGGGFAVSGTYIFWGLAVLTSLFLTPNISSASQWIFGGIVFLAPMYLILAVVDILTSFADSSKRLSMISSKDWIKLISFGYIPIGLGLLFRVITPKQLTVLLYAYFNQLVIFSLLVILLGGGFALLTSNAGINFQLSFRQNAWWVLLHSLIFGFLILLLP